MDFIDLKTQQSRIGPEIKLAMNRVLEHGQYILGPEVRQFESELARFGEAEHAVGCANGTDALILALRGWNIRHGHAVFCPSFTFVATAEAVALLGATPIFVDIDPATYNICPQSLERAIAETNALGQLEPRAIIAVDLFGQPADYPALRKRADIHNLKLISDSAQGFGCRLNGEQPIKWADVTTTSFFPAKPLGGYGDGGAILTDDDDLALKFDSLRVHGKGTDKYDNVRIGVNSRLDSLQAAILIEKLKIFPDEIKDRMRIAARYSEHLKDHVLRVPSLVGDTLSTWAQYTLEVQNRDAFMGAMRDRGIPTAAYYPKPVHRQTAYLEYPAVGNGLANTDTAAKSVVSLPMHAYLDIDTQDQIIKAVRESHS